MYINSCILCTEKWQEVAISYPGKAWGRYSVHIFYSILFYMTLCDVRGHYWFPVLSEVTAAPSLPLCGGHTVTADPPGVRSAIPYTACPNKVFGEQKTLWWTQLFLIGLAGWIWQLTSRAADRFISLDPFHPAAIHPAQPRGDTHNKEKASRRFNLGGPSDCLD
jgi:hypothetical protein